MKKFINFLIILSFISCSSDENLFLCNQTFENLLELSKNKKSVICVVLHDGISGIETDFINRLQFVHGKIENTIINFANINDEKNKWYDQLLRISIFPTTCIFNHSGYLVDIIPGDAKESIHYIGTTIKGKQPNLDFHFNNQYGEEKLELLNFYNSFINAHYSSKDNNEYLYLLDSLIQHSFHPYLLYLKMQKHINEEEFNEANNAAKEFIAICNNSNNIIDFHEEYNSANCYLNSSYMGIAPSIEIAHDIIELNECFHNTPIRFEIPVSNSGTEPLRIYDIVSGCGCIEIQGQSSSYIENQETMVFTFEITPNRNDIGYRDIIIVSNAINGPLTYIKIKCNVIN